MMKNLACLAFVISALTPASVATISLEDYHGSIDDSYVVQDLECLTDKITRQKPTGSCTIVVPKKMFKQICTSEPNQSHYLSGERVCIFKGKSFLA